MMPWTVSFTAALHRVTSQFTVLFDLSRGQNVHHCEMVLQMCFAQARLSETNLGRDCIEVREVDLSIGEKAIEFSLLLDQTLPQGHRLVLHGIEERLRLRSLSRREAQCLGMFQDVRRARISIQLGRKRQTHAATGPQVRNLLVRERLDRTLFHPGIGLVLLCRRNAASQKGDQNGDHDDFLLSGSMYGITCRGAVKSLYDLHYASVDRADEAHISDT